MNLFKKIAALAMAFMLTVSFVGCNSATAGGDSQSPASNEASDSTPQSKGKIGVVFTVAGLGGSSFNDVVFEGVQRAQKELGIEYDYVEPKSISDEQIVIEEMASSGEYDLIICIAFEMADALKAVAPEYPDQKFAFIDSSVDLPNIANYACREEQGSFLCGALVALSEQKNASNLFNDKKIIGFIGGVDSPIIRRFASGYMAGARYIDPDYEIMYDFVGNYNDPSTAKVMATANFNRGCDVIYHAAGASGLGVFQAAEELGFIAIGCNLNQNDIAPDNIIASMLKRVDNAAYHAIKSVVDGTFKGGTVILSLTDGGVGYTTEKSNIVLPADIYAKLDEIDAAIKSGSLVVPDTVEGVDAFVTGLK